MEREAEGNVSGSAGREILSMLIRLSWLSVRVGIDEFPDNTLPSAVSAKVNQFVQLMPVQTLDRVMQPPPRVHFGLRRERVVNSRGPTLLLERHEYRLLIHRGGLETL